MVAGELSCLDPGLELHTILLCVGSWKLSGHDVPRGIAACTGDLPNENVVVAGKLSGLDFGLELHTTLLWVRMGSNV